MLSYKADLDRFRRNLVYHSKNYTHGFLVLPCFMIHIEASFSTSLIHKGSPQQMDPHMQLLPRDQNGWQYCGSSLCDKPLE